MRFKYAYLMLWGCLMGLTITSHGQQITSSPIDSNAIKSSLFKRIPYKQLIVPVGLMTYGVIALESHFLIDQNQDIRTELRENIDRKFSVDDFSQYVGTASIFALDALGVKAKHTLKQRLFTAAVSNVIMTATVMSIKNTGPYGVRIALPTIPFLRDILPLLLLEQNYSGKNIRIGRYGMEWPDMLWQQELVSLGCIIINTGYLMSLWAQE